MSKHPNDLLEGITDAEILRMIDAYDPSLLGESAPELLALVKEARVCGRVLGIQEVEEIGSRHVWMGWPKPREKAPGVRGPKNKKSQYEISAEGRREAFRRLVKLPVLRKGRGTTPTALIEQIDGDLTREGYAKARAPEVRRRIADRQTGDVLRLLGAPRPRVQAPGPDVSTIRKALARAGRRRPR